MSRDKWTLLYVSSPYFQTKTIQILLKHIAYVTITNFINNLMNIMLGDWARVKILFCIKKKKSLTPCYIYIYIYIYITLLQIQFIS